MAHVAQTRPFRSPHGGVIPGSIAEAGTIKLGGLDQWVMIRGENIANPALIVLHGGPGMSETGFMRCFNAPIEKAFTVVYWDQRGAGRSFVRGIPRSSMTLEQHIADLDQLVDEISRRLGKTKVVIFGHSWGSLLGPLYAARFPQKVALYVGAAQIGDWPATEARSYAFAVAEAERQGHRRISKKLRAIGPPPYSAKSVFTERTCVMRLQGGMRPGQLWKMGRAALAGPESSLPDLVRTMRGFRFVFFAMWDEVSRLNLLELVPALPMPTVFLLGRQDRWVPPETSLAYIDGLTAPSKKVIWFEQSTHEMFFDEPARFNDVMAELGRTPIDS